MPTVAVIRACAPTNEHSGRIKAAQIKASRRLQPCRQCDARQVRAAVRVTKLCAAQPPAGCMEAVHAPRSQPR
jgi:hypothetical protein